MALAINGITATYALSNATASRAFRPPGVVRETLASTAAAPTSEASTPRQDPASGQPATTTEAKPSDVRYSPNGEQTLDASAQRELEYLKSTDRAVRAHEQAHLNAAGSLASGPATYVLKRGPDGSNYAIAGEVPLQMKKGQTPEETLALARRIQAAALAPAQPSADDRAIAAAAAQMAVEAAAELAQRSNVKAARPAGAPFPTPDAEEPAQTPRSAALARRYAEATAANIRSILAVA